MFVPRILGHEILRRYVSPLAFDIGERPRWVLTTYERERIRERKEDKIIFFGFAFERRQAAEFWKERGRLDFYGLQVLGINYDL